MTNQFFKFPSTPHLATMPGVNIREDKVLTDLEREQFLQHSLVVEEKIDGANLGISFDSDCNLLTQNRGEYLQLPGYGQWRKLDEWLKPRVDTLFEHLSNRLILFGEWCYAKHSIYYEYLPDWFLGFDVFDKESERFFSSNRRNTLFQKINIEQVPVLAHGKFSYPNLQHLLTTSKYSTQPAEGLYFRVDQGEWLEQRSKLVRGQFIQTIQEHWSQAPIQPNLVKPRHLF